MAAALIKHEQINTTTPKAKELRPYVEKWSPWPSAAGCQSAPRPGPAPRRCPELKLFDVLGQRYANRNGGYSRIIKAGIRV